MLGRRAAAVAVAVGALAIPAAAQAATRTVWMGTPPSAQKTFNEKYLADVNDYFPHTTTVRVGDVVAFAPAGFHTADIPGSGEQPEPGFSPTGQKAAGVNDAAGSPFWFNGQDLMSISPSLLQGQFGKRLSYDGSERVQSGLPLAERPKPMRVRFRKRGTVSFYCDIHPGMKGTVRVRRRSARVPSARAHRRKIRQQIRRDLNIAKGLPKQTPPPGVIDVGKAGRFGVEHLDFVPKTTRVSVGTTLRFRMSSRSFDVHTATAGPGDPEREPTSYLGAMTATLESPQIDPRLLYSSEPPGTAPASLTPTSRGNGFWNTGVMDTVDASPLPESGSVTFSAPGTYTFYCLIHPFMKGTVTAG